MSEDLRLLYELQQMETDIRQKKKRLGELVELQKETDDLKEARAAKETAAEAFAAYRTQKKELDDEIASLRRKKDETSERLYSGKVKNTKELSDMEQAIGAMERRIAALEEQNLEVMLYLEEAETEAVSSEETYKKLLGKWARAVTHYKHEQMEVATAVNEQLALRKEHLKRIPASDLKLYKKIGQKSSGVAIARLRDGRCTGCQVGVSGEKSRRAYEGERVTCGSCGRLLYV
ncbi:MAG TPA: hypothetical protein VLL52_25955 [Anaerolineae bacterium]|nr:hypothetical protein [Anaerolineae bacterium]